MGAARVVGRYALHEQLASGGMATVHLGRVGGAAGFSRTVAIKRLHAHHAKDPEFVAMFLDETRLASRVRHANVVDVLDVVAEGDELFLVLEYVHGDSLARLVRAARTAGLRIPTSIAVAIVAGALHGLHAAHEATSDEGEPLELVHRDMSPQNILIGTDGVPRVLDFGIAKAIGRSHVSREGELKGKLGYMAPEQVQGDAVVASDLFACGVMLWELLVGRRLFAGDGDSETLSRVLFAPIDPPSAHGGDARLDEVIMRALERDPSMRHASAREMALALEAAVRPAPSAEVTQFLEELLGDELRARAGRVRAVERTAVHPKDADTIVDAPPRRRGRGWLVPLATLVVAGAAAAAIAATRRAPHVLAEPVVSSAASPSFPSAVASPPPVVPSAPPSVLASASPSPSPTPKRSPVSKTPPPPKKSCDPPYRIDEHGKKVWIRECL